MMTQINLLPWREEERSKLKKQFVTLLALGIALTIVLIIIIHLVFSYLLLAQQARNAFLLAETNRIIAATKELEKEKENGLKTVSDLHFILNLQANNYQTVDVLNEITKKVPAAIVITKIDKRGKNILMQGNAVSNTDVTQFIKEMSKSTVLDKPELTKIVASEKNQETRKDFQIKVEQRDLNANR